MFIAAILMAVNASFAASAFAAEFVDSAGRRVQIAAPVRRVLPAGPPADALLLALAPDLITGLVEPFVGPKAAFAPPAYRALPKAPRITGRPDEAAIAALKALRSDLVVDYGDVNADFAALADRMSETLQTPYLLLDGKITNASAMARLLGAAVGREKRGEEIAAAIEAALATLAPLAALPETDRIAVYYARGADGLQAIRANSSLSEALAYAGARNVTPAGRGAFVARTTAEIAEAKPDIVIVADDSALAPDSVLRRALPASTRFFVDRGAPFSWIENPPSINRVIGALALASILHPMRAPNAMERARELATTLFSGVTTPDGLVERR
jgi:iron complex transport system substrate-binding protein